MKVSATMIAVTADKSIMRKQNL